MKLLKSAGAFAFGFVGSVIFLVPVLILLALAQTNTGLLGIFWLAVLIVFTVIWWIVWTVIGQKMNVYTYSDGGSLIPYSIGGALGLVVVLYYGAQINALFGV